MAIKMEIDKKVEKQVTKAEARKAARKVLKLKAKKKDLSKEEKEAYELVRNYIEQTGDRELANDVEVYQRTTQKLEKVSDDADMASLIEELEEDYPEVVSKKVSMSELEKAWDENTLGMVKRHGFTVSVSETEYVKSKA